MYTVCIQIRSTTATSATATYSAAHLRRQRSLRVLRQVPHELADLAPTRGAKVLGGLALLHWGKNRDEKYAQIGPQLSLPAT